MKVALDPAPALASIDPAVLRTERLLWLVIAGMLGAAFLAYLAAGLTMDVRSCALVAGLWLGCLAIAVEMVAARESGSIVTLLCDSGDRYACTYFNDAWLAEQSIQWEAAAQRIASLLHC